ncbi:hypothetical protein [Methanogenium cariaci]|uniref:hypothetical protein n=1 Tax=Methanogenium cariaci TaxID=2197 RepID=UPI00155DA2A4|nr:hypothetical protein [Methanogenium cariaci]
MPISQQPSIPAKQWISMTSCPPHRQATIREAVAREQTQDLRRLKAVLGERFSYIDIRLTCARDRQHAKR